MAVPRKHLLLLSNTALSARNGSSRVELALARALSDRFDVTLLTRDLEPIAGEPFEHRTYRRASSKLWRSWLFAGRVARVIAEIDREKKIDLIHAFALAPLTFYLQKLPFPYVLTHHDFRLFPESTFFKRRVLSAISAARRVTCLSAAQRDALAAGGADVSRAVVIPNGVDLAPRRHSWSVLPADFWLFAGRLEHRKGIHLLLDALEALEPSERPALVIAGEGRDQAVRDRAIALGATLLGWVDHDQLLDVISRAKAVVVPSFAEASPLVPLEAFARGVPVLIHDLPELRDQIRDESGAELARLVPVGDRAAWSDAIRTFTPDAARIERARAFAYARSWTAIAARYASLYDEALQ